MKIDISKALGCVNVFGYVLTQLSLCHERSLRLITIEFAKKRLSLSE